MKRITLTKLRESDEPLHPNNISVGDTRTGYMTEPPTEGKPFTVLTGIRGIFQTSTVQEVIDETTFRTYNSIYKITVHAEEA